MFPSVACSSYFGYFVQFSRCVLVSKTRSKHSLLSKCLHPSLEKMVGPSGLEPPTSRLSVVRSSQLSYGPVLAASSLRVPSKLNNVTSIQHFRSDLRTLQQLVSSVEVSLERR